jgi:hypothetical protein
MRFVVEIPDELVPVAATASVTADRGAVSGKAVPGGAAPDTASLTRAVPTNDALPAGEAEFGGVLAAAEHNGESVQDGGPAPS